MKCKLYDITNYNEMAELGSPKRIERNVKDMYYKTYRMIRKAYNRNKSLDLLVIGEDGFAFAISSVIGRCGILMVRDSGTTLWMRE